MDRRLPDGRLVADVAPLGEQLCKFTDHVRTAVRRWTVLAFEHGLPAVVLMLACVAAWRADHWWGTPWWSARVEEFLHRLACPQRWKDPRMTAHVQFLRPPVDRARLRHLLLVGPDHLDTRTVAWCLSAGLGDGALTSRPRVARQAYRDVAMLLEPQAPAELRRHAGQALLIERGWSA